MITTVHGELAADTLTEALALQMAARLSTYHGYLRFYEGKHWEKARGNRTQLVFNYARPIVDKSASYLIGDGIGYSVLPERASGAASRVTSQRARERAAEAEEWLYRVAEDNHLEAADMAGAVNGGVLGDTVFKVTWDARAGQVRVVNVDPFGFHARWAPDDMGRLLTVWTTCTMTALDAAESYGAGEGGKGERYVGRGDVRVVERWTADEWSLTVENRVVRQGVNPYGFIPFVHIPNQPGPNEFWGRSDLVDLVGLMREYDARMSDRSDTIRLHADPPTIFKGVESHSEVPVGPGSTWDLPEGADVKYLEWVGSTPDVDQHLERVMRAIYDMAESPKTSFGDTGRVLSGVALETELQPLIHKIKRKRALWTAGIRRRCSLILAHLQREGRLARGEYRTRIIWPPLLPSDMDAEVKNNVMLVQAGLRSHRGAMDRLGERSPEDEMERIGEDRSRLVTPEPPAPGHRPAKARERWPQGHHPAERREGRQE